MKWETATKIQLLQIVLNEQCEISYKFEAANEYKRRDAKGFRGVMKQERIKRKIGV